ncbi:MAG: hypothetical protein JNM99_20605 [Verrucomicrobiaceae bacterium]|nr:hypothetical protein [Verrucomicrobiaceae bacterium]
MNTIRTVITLFSFIWLNIAAHAATFNGSSYASTTDTTGGLSWNNASGQKALTISCWFKISLPNGGTISQPMVIMSNTGSSWNGTTFSSNHAYAIYLSPTTGNVDISIKGAGGTFTKSVIQSPYLERWYHVAVVMSNTLVTGYADGLKTFADSSNAGDSSSTSGLFIGGTSSGYQFPGEIQEVQVFQSALDPAVISDNRFQDLVPADWPDLKGYFKLAYSSTAADQLKNFAASPPTGTAALSTNGTVVFEETNREGEQSLFDSRKNDAKDAISPLSGAFSWSQTAIARPTPGMPFEFVYAYNSGTAGNGYLLDNGLDAFAPQALGAGWRHSFEARILPVTAFNPSGTRSAIGLMSWDGNVETWDMDVATASGVRFKTRSKEYRGELELIGSNLDPAATFRWVTPDRLIYTFRTAYSSGSGSAMLGRLQKIADFNGNEIILTYHQTGSKAGLVQQVTDTSGGVWKFNYDASNLLTSLTGPSDDTLEKWTVTFTYTQANNRNTIATKSITGPAAYTSTVTPALATTWTFAYAAGSTNMSSVTDPRGKQDMRITYDARGRKTTVMDALSRTTSFTYNSPAVRKLTTATSSRSVVDTFDRKLRRTSTENPAGTTSFEYDEFGNQTAIVDPRGTRTTMTYDARSNLLTRTVVPLNEVTTWQYNHTLTSGILCNKPTKVIDQSGWETSYAYDQAGNLLTQSDALGTMVTHVYDAKGLVTSSRDGNNNDTRFTYNSSGFLTARTIAFGTPKASTATVVPSELGWVMSETNALNQTVTYLRNINGQAVRTTDPLGRQFSATFDANGNLTSESDAKGSTTSYTYDDADQRTAMTDRVGSTWNYTYTYWGEPETVQTPAAMSDGTTQRETTTKSYDQIGRLITETDVYGGNARFEYDANGNVTASVDKAGQRWTRTYDVLNRPITSTDPLGNVTTTTYDVVGRVKTITSPNGFPTQHEYDGRGRLKKWTDPMGSAWLYTYDGNTNIIDIQDALGGHYLMTYGPANERLTERNQDNQTWTYTYDALFRLLTQTDPNGTTRTLVRDAAGRTERGDFGSGRTNSLTYDDNNNPTLVIRSAPGSAATATILAYDSLDRLTSVQDTFGKTVGYSYDVLSRVVNKTYPGGKVLTHTYDRLHRLKGQSFNFGSQTFATAFTYDAVGRLNSQTYPNGLYHVNSFDNAGRVRAVDHQVYSTGAVQIALTYAYDKNGNKTGGTNQGDVVWTPAQVTAYDDTSRFTPAGKLIDRVDAAPASPKTFAYTYDSSGNMTRAATPGDAEVYALTYDEDNRTTSITYTTALTTKSITNRYDALGRRIARIADGIQTRYVLDLVGGMERILCDTDASGQITAWHVHSPAGLSYSVTPAGVLTCYHADAQGNIIRTTTTDGPDADTIADTVSEYAYTPYGRRLVTTGTASNPYRFVGSQGVMEELPNLYFMRARYYSAEAAVFLSTDPYKPIGVGWKPEPYTYCFSNPSAFFDPDGNEAYNTQLGWELTGGIDLPYPFTGFYGTMGGMVDVESGSFSNPTPILDAGLSTGVGAGLSAKILKINWPIPDGGKVPGVTIEGCLVGGAGICYSSGPSGKTLSVNVGLEASLSGSGSFSDFGKSLPVSGTINTGPIMGGEATIGSTKTNSSSNSRSTSQNTSKPTPQSQQSKTPSTAFNTATNLNQQQKTPVAPPTRVTSPPQQTTKLQTTITAKVETVQAKIAQTYTTVKTKVVNTYNSVKTSVSSFFSNVKSFFGGRK